jgi:hypothetical protein
MTYGRHSIGQSFRHVIIAETFVEALLETKLRHCQEEMSESSPVRK